MAHECIVDVRGAREGTSLSIDDIAKRLIDYGFHAPTMSWPVADTLMVEPTESESKEELDRFVAAMKGIHDEIRDVVTGKAKADDNVLVNAPHIVEPDTLDAWPHDYTRAQAFFPAGVRQTEGKYFPPVGRIDNVGGDRNPVCSCPPMSAYLDE